MKCFSYVGKAVRNEHCWKIHKRGRRYAMDWVDISTPLFQRVFLGLVQIQWVFRGRESVRFKVWTPDPAGAPPPDSLARPVVLPAFLDLATPLWTNRKNPNRNKSLPSEKNLLSNFSELYWLRDEIDENISTHFFSDYARVWETWVWKMWW